VTGGCKSGPQERGVDGSARAPPSSGHQSDSNSRQINARVDVATFFRRGVAGRGRGRGGGAGEAAASDPFFSAKPKANALVSS